MENEPDKVCFSVTCPICRKQAIAEYRYRDLVEGVLNHRPIRLFAPCHSTSWVASYVEVQRIRSRFRALQPQAREAAEPGSAEDSFDD